MRKKMRTAFAAISIALAGCASTGELTKDLKPSNAADQYNIKAKITYVDLRGPFNARWEEGLLPCVFKPVRSNSDGTFYEGNGKCVTQKMGEATLGSPFHGGVWIPTDSKKPPRLYYYFDYDGKDAFAAGGLITMAILESGKGDLTFMPDIKDSAFLAALNASHQPAP
jgi:hypothetical protein